MRVRRLVHVGAAIIWRASRPAWSSKGGIPIGRCASSSAPRPSKARAEASLRALFPDLPRVVARPSMVIGHTTPGARPSSSIPWLVRAVDRRRLLPCGLDEAVDIVQADWTADALHDLQFRPRPAHDTYHLSAGRPGRRAGLLLDAPSKPPTRQAARAGCGGSTCLRTAPCSGHA